MSKVLAIVPARGGSKGIKNKNIIDVCGQPLIAFTLKPALKLKKKGLLDEVIVSTDSEKIAQVAKDLGGYVPFLRPKNISGDKALSVDYILHAIEYFEQEGTFYDAVVILQPTSPLRTASDISDALKIYRKHKDGSLISAYHKNNIMPSIVYYKSNQFAIPFLSDHNQGMRRQDGDAILVRNGAIYITAVEYIKQHKKIVSDKPLLFEMPEERSLNIDYPDDLETLRSRICK